jgi:predicted NBD/HSP70 family sugar kinase
MRRISPTTFRVARRGTSREINRQIALNLVRVRQPISRADLARVMGVRRGAVSRIVNDLLDSGSLFEGAKGESKGGRKPMHLYIETRRRCALAVDINATRTAILATDLLGQPLVEVRDFPTGRRPRALLQQLARAIRQLLADHPELGRCVGIGVVVSGVVDFDGRLKFSPTLGWRDVDLRRPLKAATKLPVVVENSVKACILAQVWSVRGDAPVEGPVAFVNISDGVGVGIAIDGKLLRGTHNMAGEAGHLTIDLRGPRCSCGQRGCWESFVSKRAIVARYRRADLSWPGSAALKGPSLEAIVARARAGDDRALAALRETAEYLGRGFAALVKVVDPRRIYVGGEITAAWDLVAPAIRAALRAQALIPEAAQTEILTVPLGEHPRLRGAAALVSTPAFAAPIVA